jgi:hypothetical protein
MSQFHSWFSEFMLSCSLVILAPRRAVPALKEPTHDLRAPPLGEDDPPIAEAALDAP